jgi:hypothetical protein
MRRILKFATIALLALPLATAMGAPVGYSVNSDAGDGEDKLHLIDFSDGSATPIGFGVYEVAPPALIDIEGLAFDSDGNLWGIDDESVSLFQIELEFGNIKQGTRVGITGLDVTAKNDFGMTFTCEGDIYATSVTKQSLYILDKDGKATRIGDLGSLAANISALASYGHDPVRIVGLGNGDNRTLYEIDTIDGTASAIGVLGNGVAPYDQAGLSFDENGDLYGITDRSALSLDGDPSQILSIDSGTGEGSVLFNTSVIGFESLAIASPTGCATSPDGHVIIPHEADIPTLDNLGKLFAILVLVLTGFTALRQRIF